MLRSLTHSGGRDVERAPRQPQPRHSGRRGDPRLMLHGRRRECTVLDGLFERARAGRSGTLVVHGEPGVGKTALLEYAIDSASDMRVVRAVGVESEMELPFAALHQLCAPMLDRLDRLPGPQRDALAITFGLRAGVVPDRLLVGTGGVCVPVRGGGGGPLRGG